MIERLETLEKLIHEASTTADCWHAQFYIDEMLTVVKDRRDIIRKK